MSTPNNIFFNEFYEEPALPRWNFDVAFIFHDVNSNYESSESTYAKNVTYSELLSKAVTNIKLPEMKIEKLVTYLPGFHFAFPGKPGLNGEISIKFNDDLSLTIRRIADYLLQYNYNPRYQQHDSFSRGTDNYLSIAHTVVKDTTKNFIIAPKFDIYVRIYNVYNEFIQKVIYKNCFVKSIGNIELDYAGEDIVSTSITVSYPYFKVLNPDEIDNQYDDLIYHVGGAPNRNDTKIGENPYGDILETPDNSNNVEQNDKPITEEKQPILEDEISKNEQTTPAKLPQIEDTKKEDGTIENPNTPAVADNQDTSEPNKTGVSEVIDTNAEEQPIMDVKDTQPEEPVATNKPIDGIASSSKNTIEGVDMDRLKKVLGKAEGSTDFVYSNVIGDEQGIIDKQLSKDEQARIKNGEHVKGKNGVEYFWDEKKNRFAHYDIATIGKGLTFKNALANKDVTLIDENGNKVTKKGKEWDATFEKAGRNSMPNGKGADMGGTPTTTKWKIGPDHAEDLFNQSLESYIKDAKKQANKAGLDWDNLSQEEKLILVDNDYNGGGGKAAKAAKAIKETGGLNSYENALKFAKDTTNTLDTLRRIDYVNDGSSNYAKQFKKSNEAFNH